MDYHQQLVGISMYALGFVCGFVYMCLGAQGSQRCLVPLDPELEGVMSHMRWVLGTEVWLF